ncbi:MAG TPA: PadR family transcriptional regulator, partial [Gemmatimonadaceae bacterium]|nr:PadR family transcriptional regulator [Gemmatimonadaceae bacterium]
MPAGGVDVLQGTLDMLVLKALSWRPMHGYNILGWLRQATDGELRIEDAALYPALHRMEARGLIEAEWGLSENNRRAKFYRLTARGRRELRAEAESWSRYVAVIGKVMTA